MFEGKGREYVPDMVVQGGTGISEKRVVETLCHTCSVVSSGLMVLGGLGSGGARGLGASW